MSDLANRDTETGYSLIWILPVCSAIIDRTRNFQQNALGGNAGLCVEFSVVLGVVLDVVLDVVFNVVFGIVLNIFFESQSQACPP